MSTKFKRWDSSENLKTQEDMAAYLQACLEEDDLELIIHALGVIAKAKGMAQLASETGLGRESLYKALAPGAKPRFETIYKVIRALGIHLHAA
ncbi:MAG: putative addiction module antidote protein [Alphaproteobacteria bacterium RIFOXYD12_FULL_60_8]|nr:MAG: putative addiction module antidote protein [Alphaproteobacteria bacterium RIFOXYD12_FULL_60_8]